MIQSFHDSAVEDIFNGRNTKSARQVCPQTLWKMVARKLDLLDSARSMVRIPTHRTPTHPGDMLREEFLEPLWISQRELAEAIGVPYQRVNELVNGRRGVTPSTALRLSQFLGTSPEFWLNLQLRWELYWTQQKEGREIGGIERSEKVPEARVA